MLTKYKKLFHTAWLHNGGCTITLTVFIIMSLAVLAKLFPGENANFSRSTGLLFGVIGLVLVVLFAVYTAPLFTGRKREKERPPTEDKKLR